MAEEKGFENGRELLAACAERLGQSQGGEVGGNVALYPTVIVMLGERARKYTRYIKNTLDDNWNNSGFLQYVSIQKSGEAWKCERSAAGKGQKDPAWSAAEGKPDSVVSKAIVEMLEQDERIFKDKSCIKMEFVMDAAEEDGKDYYELYLGLKNGLHSADLKTFYLMLDQKPEEGRHERSDGVLQYLLQNRNRPGTNCGTTYLLSNYLDSGSILGENKIWQNYRLIADIILLGGNRARGESSGYVTNLYNGVKTASYALLTKPIDDIAGVALQVLMREMYEREESHAAGELTEKEIRERLGCKATHGFGFAEEIFQKKILRQLPSAEDLRYLPFRSERELRELERAERISDEKMDACTLGAWSLLRQEGYLDVADALLEDAREEQDIRRAMQDLFQGAFSLFEAMKLAPRQDMIRQMIQEEFSFNGVSARACLTEKLHQSAVYECKRHFYERVKRMMAEEFDSFLEQARRFQELYLRCEREIRQERIVTGDEDRSVEAAYEGLVKRYVEQRQGAGPARSAFSEIFDTRHSQESLLGAVWEVFQELTKDEVFGCDFEKELAFRMSNMTDLNRQLFVKDSLRRKLEGSIRLKNLMNVMTKVSCFYLVNEVADYAKQLAQQEENGRDFMLYNLRRTDCIEQIEIYQITKTENLHLNQ